MSDQETLDTYYKREENLLKIYQTNKDHGVLVSDWLNDVTRYFLGKQMGADTTKLGQALFAAKIIGIDDLTAESVARIRERIKKELEKSNTLESESSMSR